MGAALFVPADHQVSIIVRKHERSLRTEQTGIADLALAQMIWAKFKFVAVVQYWM